MTANVSITGGLVRPIELRFTAQGKAVASGTVASTERYKKGDEWVDGKSLYLPITVWGEQAENIASANLEAGQQVTVTGSLYTRKFEDKSGAQRSVTELEVKDFAVSLKRSTAVVTKAGGSNAGRSSTPQEPWGQPAPQQTAQADVWGAPGASYNEEVPF